MTNTQPYADLEIRILERQDAGYPVEITLNADLQYPRGFLSAELPTGDDDTLFAWLFADATLREAWEHARGQHPQRRIRLRIDATAPELHALPWESLRDPATGLDLAATDATPFSRYLAGMWHPGTPLLTRPLKLLVAIAAPENLADYGLAPLDAEAEWAALCEVTASQEVTLTRLPAPCTLTTFEAELRRGYHALHLIAHGVYRKEKGAALFLTDDDNQVAPMTDADFAAMLKRQLADSDPDGAERLRLVFLASCQSATRDSADAFRGLAPRLVEAGVPAIVAMQDYVSLTAAREFSRAFYRQLATHGRVDLASNQARAALLTAGSTEAATPVVFSRLRSGKLFEQRGEILGEQASSFWQTLLENIADGLCTPFLGPGVTEGLLPTTRELAQMLARSYNYPFADCETLPRVAQFVGTMDNRRLRREVLRLLAEGFCTRVELPPPPRGAGLTEVIASVGWREQLQSTERRDPHAQLAALGLPTYLTTNCDPLMALALEAAGRPPRRMSVPWREKTKTHESRPHWSLDPPPTAESPVVLHLFGQDDDPLSLVLTEDDHLDYLARIARDYEYLLPTSVNAALASTTLLFLGYRLEDLNLKVIMRGLLTNLDLDKWGMLHVAVQLETARTNTAQEQEVIRYFQKYFANARIDVYWGSSQQFMTDLYTRWQSFQATRRPGNTVTR